MARSEERACSTLVLTRGAFEASTDAAGVVGGNMAKDRTGAANFYDWGDHPDFSNMGGGMSASENRMVNHVGQNIAAKGGPRDTSRGASLERDSTNKKATWGCNPEPASPCADPQTRNKPFKTGGY